MVEPTPESILFRPVTAENIRQLRGILKPCVVGPTVAQEMAAHKSTEKQLEEKLAPRHPSLTVTT